MTAFDYATASPAARQARLAGMLDGQSRRKFSPPAEAELAAAYRDGYAAAGGRVPKAAAPKPVKVAAQPALAATDTDPFGLLRAALTNPAGRAMVRAIVDELKAQQDRGWSQGSVRLAAEVVRRTAPATAGMTGDYRLNSNVLPAIARWLLQCRPALRGWLEVRHMAGEAREVTAAYGDAAAPLPVDARLFWLDPSTPFVPSDSLAELRGLTPVSALADILTAELNRAGR